MGMIHAYKIIQTTKEQDPENDLNEVDYSYLVEMQKRSILEPKHLSDKFPFVLTEENTSAHDNVNVGMMNVFHLLGERKSQGLCLNDIDCEYLVNSLIPELSNVQIYLDYDNYFIVDDQRKDLV
tara:strand:+ start:106 stop:477 length:372 start_codon:yes stop_codon:yes gene_type:complete